MKRLWRNDSLLWVMLLILVVMFIIESGLSYRETATMYRWHGEVMTMTDFWLGLLRQVAGRVAASVFVLIIFTVARAYLVYIGSPVSKDGPDERTALLRQIQQDIVDLQKQDRES